MKISEILTESDYRDTTLPLDKYRGPYDPRTMQPYSDQYTDSFELVDVVEELIDDGVEPQVVAVDPKTLTATQDWLSDQGGAEDLYSEYRDHPVVLDYRGHFYVLDGHHRCSRALRSAL